MYKQIRPKLSPCARRYLAALVDPWRNHGEACVPDNITVPSKKYKFRARGTFHIGAAGVGFIVLQPFVASNDRVIAYYSTTAYPSATINTTDSEANVVSWNSPYEEDAFNPMLFRLVGCAVRVRYSGSEYYRSGRVVLWNYPSKSQPFATDTTIPSMLSNPNSNTAPANRAWHSVHYAPYYPTDIDYRETSSVEQRLAIAVDGSEPGQPFEFDIMGSYEFIGPSATEYTDSHADPVGMGVVNQSVTPEMVSIKSSSQQYSTYLSKSLQLLMDSVSGVTNYASDLVDKYPGGSSKLIADATQYYLKQEL